MLISARLTQTGPRSSYGIIGGGNQRWLVNGGYVRDGTIVNVQSGKCLDADLSTINANGTKVQLWDCWGGKNQQWRANNDGTIVNVQSGRCLDADLGTINTNGAKVQLWDCWRGENQKWSIDFENEGAHNCAHCNDGSCQCGSGTADELCANHNGNDPAIGCTQQE
jgi:Ricin-type beta-trefoil lectin domain-like